MKVSAEKLKNSFDPLYIETMIEKFAHFGKDSNGGVTRLAFSAEDLESRQEFIRIVKEELNLPVRIDTLGNIFFRREGRYPNLPVIMTGSHLESVRNGGKYDGPAGVFTALEAFRVLDKLKIQTNHPFELAVIASEEPNTFGLSTFGSRGMVGLLDEVKLAKLTDENGQELPDALARIGGDLTRINEAVRSSGEIKNFVELHIEQMTSLEREGKDIGVVQGITGIYREDFEVVGVASHCGTTPMSKRHDALCAAAEIVLAIEEAARLEDGAAVATVGRLRVLPNSTNITPGRVIFTAEIRSYSEESIQRVLSLVNDRIVAVSKQRNINIQRQGNYFSKPSVFSTIVTETIKLMASELDLSSMDIVSMAGHDAGHLNRIAESGMVFIPCRDGVSHTPEEYTDTKSMLRGAQCLLATLLSLDQDADVD